MNQVAAIVLSRLNDLGHTFPLYFKYLEEACSDMPPPYGERWYGVLYRELARDPVWMANSLLVNAEKEGLGSRQIWKFASVMPVDEYANLIRQHSIDESRHSRMFVRLLDYTFETALTNELRAEFLRMSPGYTWSKNPGNRNHSNTGLLSKFEAIDELVQVNLVEIRSLVLQLLLRPVVLEYAPPSFRDKIDRMLMELALDEVNHIAYSAGCLELEAQNGNAEFVHCTIRNRQTLLNTITCEEVSKERFEMCGDCRACTRVVDAS